MTTYTWGSAETGVMTAPIGLLLAQKPSVADGFYTWWAPAALIWLLNMKNDSSTVNTNYCNKIRITDTGISGAGVT